MFIAFEGPDNVGKSTSAAKLSHNGLALYNATKPMHEFQQSLMASEGDVLVTYDRIDWFSHMMYRLAMPTHEWNDERARTVFAMPDTHLVVKIHRPDLAPLIDDELYETGKLAEVNPMYWYFGDFLMDLNRVRGYALFKSVSIMEVSNDPRDGSFTQKLVLHDSEAFGNEDTYSHLRNTLVTSDEELVEHLRHVDQHVG